MTRCFLGVDGSREAIIFTRFLIADEGEQIWAGREAVFPDSIQVMDLYHLKKALKNHLGSDNLTPEQKKDIK